MLLQAGFLSIKVLPYCSKAS